MARGRRRRRRGGAAAPRAVPGRGGGSGTPCAVGFPGPGGAQMGSTASPRAAPRGWDSPATGTAAGQAARSGGGPVATDPARFPSGRRDAGPVPSGTWGARPLPAGHRHRRGAGGCGGGLSRQQLPRGPAAGGRVLPGVSSVVTPGPCCGVTPECAGSRLRHGPAVSALAAGTGEGRASGAAGGNGQGQSGAGCAGAVGPAVPVPWGCACAMGPAVPTPWCRRCHVAKAPVQDPALAVVCSGSASCPQPRAAAEHFPAGSRCPGWDAVTRDMGGTAPGPAPAQHPRCPRVGWGSPAAVPSPSPHGDAVPAARAGSCRLSVRSGVTGGGDMGAVGSSRLRSGTVPGAWLPVGSPGVAGGGSRERPLPGGDKVRRACGIGMRGAGSGRGGGRGDEHPGGMGGGGRAVPGVPGGDGRG